MTDEPTLPTTRYVIVVHGIGQQKKNETVLPVIYRFAEARAAAELQFGDPITRGLMASHLREAPAGEFTEGLEEHWIEFDGIPQDPEATRVVPFIGRKPERPGDNLRFVDMHWASVMDSQFDAFGEPIAVWTRALIDRLESRQAPEWIREQLHTLRSGVIPLQKLLYKKAPGHADEIFDRFLGDIQLYGEYLATRGMAVRRFHERLAKIERRHKTEELRRLEALHGTGVVPGLEHFDSEEFRARFNPSQPRYTVIAHSLGSIMSFDALLFAHMRPPPPASGQKDLESLEVKELLELLPEYDRDPSTGELNDRADPGRFPDLGWIKNVDSFVTLGSPIDKFLVLWWLNYEHLAPPKDWWLDRSRLRPEPERIRHYNYCDAQDPVGHQLDVAYSDGTVTSEVFRREEEWDVVFTRYSTPGKAHVDYWTDSELFQRILTQAVDDREPPKNISWFKPFVYLKALFWTYFSVPLLAWLLGTGVLVWTIGRAETSVARLGGLLLVLGITAGAGWLMSLLIPWRAAVTIKEESRPQKGKWARRAFGVVVLLLPLLWLHVLLASANALWWDLLVSEENPAAPMCRQPPGLSVGPWPDPADLAGLARPVVGPLASRLKTVPGVIERAAGRLGLATAKPDQNHTWILASLTAALLLGFVLALWRLFLQLRVRFEWWYLAPRLPPDESLGRFLRWWHRLRRIPPDQRLRIPFCSYLDTDPTRPDPLDGEVT